MEVDNDNVPQWKKDLIARLRSQNRAAVASVAGDQQLAPSPQVSCGKAGHQPGPTCKTASVQAGVSSGPVSDQCNVISTCPQPQHSKMVQERAWMDNKHDTFAEMVTENYNNNGYHKDSDSDSSEDLHYGPGIVNKLKNKYLSLALRESNRSRPSILHMRKATSLENLLDDEIPDETRGSRQFQSRLNGNDTGRTAVPNRYRNAARGEMKRARSVEAISRYDNHHTPNRQSLHEEMLIAKEVDYNRKNDTQMEGVENKFSGHRINRPKRIQPIMNEKEKPPADFVKQAKMIFERRPEQRTRAPPQTGDVAAKVDSFNNIIVKAKVEAKVSKKPPIKQTKPVLNDKPKSNTHRPVAKPVIVSEEILKVPPKTLDLNKKKELRDDVPLPSPIPDVSRIDFHNKDAERKNATSLSETPDLILVSSPLPPISSPTYNKTASETFIKEEIRVTSPMFRSPLMSPNRISSPTRPVSADVSDNGFSPNSGKQSGSSVFNFTHQSVDQSHLPLNKNVSTAKTPPSQPLNIEINGHYESKVVASSPKLLLAQSPPLPPRKTDPAVPLTSTEIEKNLKNAAKTLQQPKSVVCVNASVEVVNKSIVPKKSGRPREPASNTAVFNFTNRKDVPDYISNDRSRTPGRPELPKPGEGGIILIPSAVSDPFVDEDEEILRSLEGPPSPCDVTFINDNILIDGKSSFSQRTKQMKLRISFVEAGPDVYEYPSETSLLLDESPPSPTPAQIGHTVPNLSGSTLANYTPKAMEEFHPGVTRSVQQTMPDVTEVEVTAELIVEEIDMPFSSGTNADILF